jgi:hypothetical protein
MKMKTLVHAGVRYAAAGGFSALKSRHFAREF